MCYMLYELSGVAEITITHGVVFFSPVLWVDGSNWTKLECCTVLFLLLCYFRNVFVSLGHNLLIILHSEGIELGKERMRVVCGV